MRQSRSEIARVRLLVWQRDGGACVRCGRQDEALSWDHRQNRSQGGMWAASNGQLLCGTGTTGCHGWKTENPQEARTSGFAVPGWARPWEWPAYRQTALGGRWCLYGDDGLVMFITEREAAYTMGGETETTNGSNP